MTKPRVLASLEDQTGQRCVDILVYPDGFGWVECRRDPEDSFGWRRQRPDTGPAFETEADARKDARANLGWVLP